MNNPLVYQAIGVLLVLSYIFLLVMCWKTWRVTHVLFSFFTFAAAATFLIFASFVLKTHAAWRTHFEQHTVAIEKLQVDNEQYLHGDLEEVQQTEDSIRSLRASLESTLVDRGRVWRECRPLKQVGPGEFRVSTIPLSQPEGTPPLPNGIVPMSVLYAFTEQGESGGVPGSGHLFGGIHRNRRLGHRGLVADSVADGSGSGQGDSSQYDLGAVRHPAVG
jgi:hypothetical protein